MNGTLDMLPEGMMGDKQCSGVLGKALGFLMHMLSFSVPRLTSRATFVIKLYRRTLYFGILKNKLSWMLQISDILSIRSFRIPLLQ